ncbi:MAG TPA: helix-turn-helix domain-containing protein [Candidatus Thalassarchaeaceae archaeon]|jgi:DNA-binding transcriptional ArsR family regulator|nr:helix-turn-helix domain-containing protein [Candidatus Thalassarchaeaceae archaeon]HJM19093.1 helix-turn-helix domain-containing protein [Candidatus Thalassarchaeaceae archaeon]HJM86877.1 helix-turn-helix domain-containing protein [Candidatus Thalassarchaeaceae archaeon]
MTKIRGDSRQVALAHETRRGIVKTLQGVEEKSTVQIQEAINVTRYHLYHHLQQLTKAGIIENHRDQGRARWWRLTGPIDIDGGSTTTQPDLTDLPEEIATLIRGGADIHWIETPSSARDAIAAKKMLESVAEEWGVELNLPFTFTPSGILVIGKSRN